MTKRIVALACLLGLVACTELGEDIDNQSDASADAGADAGQHASGGAGGSGGVGGSGGTGGSSDAGAGGSPGSGGGGSGGDSASCTGCDPEASCELAAGSARCVCPSDQLDVEGDGSECVDPCSVAACHAEARCTPDGLETECQCVSPFVGNGEQCELDTECMLLDCDDNAECVVTGADRACRCLTGYEGSGTSCTNVDDCAQEPCLNGGACTDDVNGYHCDCDGTGFEGDTCSTNHDDCASNPCVNGECVDEVNGYACECDAGYGGDTCEIDSCDPSPCPAGFTCTRTASTPTCTPPCGSECELGEACSEDAHCGDGLSCHDDDDVCVGPCPGDAVTSAADLAGLRYCTIINGNLTIESSSAAFNAIDASDLPYLTTINGGLLVGEIDDTPLDSITLAALERVTTLIRVQAQVGMTLISMPALTSVGTTAGSAAHGIAVQQGTTGHLVMPQLHTVNGHISFGLSSLDNIDLRRLTTVNGALSFGDFPSPLTNIDLRALTSVTGNLTARYLFAVPFTDVSRLTTGSVTVGGTRTVDEIGCCFINSGGSLSYMCSGTFDDYDAYCD